MSKIIAVCGSPESGKTTFGEMLKKSFEEKAQRVLMINYADAVKHIARQYYNWNGEKDQYGRSLLQKIGTEMGRNMIDEDIWVIIVELFINLMKDDFDVFIIGDCRFPNEIEYWEDKNNYYSIRIARENHSSQLTDEQKQHASETSLDDYDNFDFVIQNNDTLERLQEWSYAVVENILLRSCN